MSPSSRLIDRLRGRWQSWFWSRSQTLRRPLRAGLRAASVAAYRWRHWRQRRGGGQPPRVVHAAEAIDAPAVGALSVDGSALRIAAEGDTESMLRHQTWAIEAGVETAGALATLLVESADEALPATTIESLVMALACEPLTYASAVPADTNGRALGRGWRLTLLLAGGAQIAPAVVGRQVRQIVSTTTAQPEAMGLAIDGLLLEAQAAEHGAEDYSLRPDISPGTLLRQPVFDLDQRLAAVSSVDGPPTALFLMPYLAVGGAERLLFDLLDGLASRYRLLVVTLEPHGARLGQTVDRCRRSTPYVFTLGDWLPRAAHAGALGYLLRRYQVESLVSWNGTVLFYDLMLELRRQRPELRIVHQLFNHEGGWIEHTTRQIARQVDLHLAVNQRIEQALVSERGAAAERVRLIYHGVEVPPVDGRPDLPTRLALRRQLGLPAGALTEEALVVGSFIRLHEQKRPFDILELARRLDGRGIYFLLVGGGPLDAAIDAALDSQPIANLVRLPFRHDVDLLYQAIDVCLMTSAYEGLPVFLLDGLARSLPCVATDVGDIHLLADGGGAKALPVGDLEALGDALLHYRDADVRRRAGKSARATIIERFGLERYRQRYEAAIFGLDDGASDD